MTNKYTRIWDYKVGELRSRVGELTPEEDRDAQNLGEQIRELCLEQGNARIVVKALLYVLLDAIEQADAAKENPS